MASKFSVCCVLFGLAMFVCSGCSPKSNDQPSAMGTSGTTAADDHDHAHDHGEHGPHGGHMLHLEPDGVHAEWSHDDDSKTITVYLDELSAAPSEVKFVVKAGDTEPQDFALAKSEGDAEGSKGGGTWTITSDALMTHLAMGEAAKVELVVVEGDKRLTSSIEHSDEHHHH
ncbi:MAG: hypothetical protein ACTHOU_15515 [Aureliella sp.]